MKDQTTGVIVVGGGLAGLTAALGLARRGIRVSVLEKGTAWGGRARTQERDGFLFNLGPHALYRGGAGMGVLRRLGIAVQGRVPPAAGGYAVHGGRLHTLPVGMASLLTTGLLDLRGKAAFARLLARVPRLEAGAPELAETSVSQWLDRQRVPPIVRQLMEALFRVATYGRDADVLCAGAALGQLQSAYRASVLYLDGGWQSLVEALAYAAVDAGATLTSSATVTGLEREGQGWVARLADGTSRRGAAVVLAVGPREGADMVAAADASSLSRAAREAQPVFVASLDLALSRLPRPRGLFALGVDRPLYLSVHSATARLAPDGGAVLHAAAYLGASIDIVPRHVRAELEALVDLVQPGWRDVVVRSRFLPRLRVANGLPSAAQGGLVGRPSVATEMPGLFLAGDWIGPVGLLADASLASGEAAAEAAAARLADSRHAA